MKRVKGLYILSFLFGMVSMNSNAADYQVSVCQLQTSDHGKAFLSPCEDWTSKNGCPSTAPWVTWNISTDAGKLMYSTALAALVSGLQVKVRVDGSTCDVYDVTSMIRISK